MRTIQIVPTSDSKEATLRLSRTDLVPLLTIMAGGAIGFSLSVGILALSRSGAVEVTPVLLYEDAAIVEPETDAPARLGTVTGQVIDAQTGHQVAAAQVSIASLDLAVQSQRTGHYSLENVAAGTYTLAVARIGYRIAEVQITVGGGETVEHNFVLARGAVPPPLVIVPAQAGTVRGEVLDVETGDPVWASQVFISSLDVGVLSLQSGRYSLQNVPPGTYTLSVSRLGYGTVSAQIEVGSSQTVEQNFAMPWADLPMDSILLGGAGYRAQRRRGISLDRTLVGGGEARNRP